MTEDAEVLKSGVAPAGRHFCGAQAQLMGIGPITASAVIATVDDFAQFKNGAQFGAWCGITPSQDSSGGKTRLGRITRRGDTYLRSLLVQGAKSAVMTAHKRSDPSRVGRWRCASARAGRSPQWRWPTRTRASSGR
jgi:transposase